MKRFLAVLLYTSYFDGFYRRDANFGVRWNEGKKTESERNMKMKYENINR